MTSADDPLDSLHNQVVKSKQKWIAESAKTPAELPPNKYIFCNQCNGETNHICKADYVRHYLAYANEYLGGIMYTTGYRLWMCAGCESCILEQYDASELSEDENGEPEFSSHFFPKRTEYNLSAKRFKQLPTKLNGIYEEVIQAFNNELSILCATGIRALIEGICADKGITGKNLEKKIDGLTSVLPSNIVVNLHNFRFMGNEAAHELSALPQEELRLAIEICEDLLNYLYELDYKANSLSQARASRKSSGNDSSSEDES